MSQLQDRKGLFILITILIVVGVIQAQNMLQFPYFQDIEGVNASNAWALTTEGDLSAYTYAYDEPPVGTLLYGLWTSISGGIAAFGFSLYSGRVLMLIFFLLSAGMVYEIARKTAKSEVAAIAATLIFCFSPLVIGLHRRVLLDNIGMFWLLLSLNLILGERRSLGNYLASAVSFGIAVLSKGALLAFLPAFFIIIGMLADPTHKRFARTLWVLLALVLVFFYPLYAQMRQEFCPPYTFCGGQYEHVSLLERFSDRGADTGRFLNIGAGFAESFDAWVDVDNETADPVLVYVGMVGALFIAVLGIDNRNMRAITVTTVVGYGLYLALAGQIFNSDVIAALPLLAINIGLVIGSFTKFMTSGFKTPAIRYVLGSVLVIALLYPFAVYYSTRAEVHTANQVAGQLEAINWVRENVPSDAVIATDAFAFVELRQSHPNTHHYWRVDTDPDVRYNILGDDLCNIDYIVSSPQVYADIFGYGLDLMRRTFDNSELLITYPNSGWPIEIRQINRENCAPAVAQEVSGN